MAQPRLKMRLGDLLVQEQIISDDQLQLALQQQRQTGRKLGVIPPFFGALKSRGHAACAKRCFGV
ncbi:hypothetical protein [Aeromonas rivipollensis]|uniref:hypothetical protein n=1 Tax=Aeromonas rivipollensis TaxID=948519 RepID=UPI003D1C1F20